MIYRKNGAWKLCPKKVTISENGEQKIKYTNKPEWYQNFAQKWEKSEIIEIVDSEYTQEQIDRLEKVKHMSEGHGEAVRQYVETGEFPEGMDLAELLRTGKIKSNVIPSEYRDEEIEEV
jgi:hypothetical protein